MIDRTTGYWVESPGHGALRDVPLPMAHDGDLRVRAVCTGISSGTERLVGLGRVPAECATAMACRGMLGSFALPILYGYCFVGVVERGPDAGRPLFVMRPHQRHAVVPRDEVVWLPESMPFPRATLFANLETARNAVWDAALAGGERVAVIGAGAVGILLAFVLDREHRGEVVVVEPHAERRASAARLPWIHHTLHPDEVVTGTFGHALHTSGTAAGLQLAVDCVGFEGQVTELSWYGTAEVALRLGGSFHFQRKRIVSSQVGTVAASRREHGYAARHRAVLELLAAPELDLLPAEPIPFEQLPASFEALYVGQLDATFPTVGY